MIRAVVFDLGGVVLDSPFDVIRATERRHGLESGFFNRVASRPNGAWALHETGTLDRRGFVAGFEEECRSGGAAIDANRLLDEIEAYARPRPQMLAAMARLKEAGYLVAALTNNWDSPAAGWEGPALHDAFDVFVESWVEGVRKPDPAIYLRLLERLAVEAGECVFLDDIGQNLKTARNLGLATIKVTDPDQALSELGAMLGFDF
ncbi:MAG: HAD family phosphatase [Acidimicrobiia bacterium]|nr:HAD family phosphatase [Acidimicrobiia bacterium]